MQKAEKELPTASAVVYPAYPPRFDAYEATLQAIAVEIEELGTRYPALATFDAERHLHLEYLSIGYEHRAERVTVQRGRKQQEEIQPKPGGLYLHIDFHEDVEEHESRIGLFRGHYRNRDRRVLYLVRVGKENGDLGERLWEIVSRHGTMNVGLGWSGVGRKVSR